MLVPFSLLALALLPTIRFGAVELVPDEMLPLGGYTARAGKLSEPGGDSIGARCVLFESGSTKLALVSIDLLTIPESLVREVKAKLQPGILPMLVATHTHSAPDSQMLNDRMTFKVPGIATYSQRWLDWYADGIAALITGTAAEPEEEGGFGVRLVRLNLNRGRRPGAWPDSSGILLELVGSQRTRPLLYAYAAHAVFYGAEENRLRGDWPFKLSEALNGCAVVPGAIGDVSPASPGADPAERIGNFVKSTMEALNAAKPATAGAPFALSTTPIILPAPMPHPDFAKTYSIPPVLAEEMAKKFAPANAEITGFRLGKLAVIGVPGEPTAELGRRIRDAGWNMGFRWVAVVSHTNGWLGYLLAPNDYRRGGYEALLSFNGPELGENVVDAAVKTLTRLRNREETSLKIEETQPTTKSGATRRPAYENQPRKVISN